LGLLKEDKNKIGFFGTRCNQPNATNIPLAHASQSASTKFSLTKFAPRRQHYLWNPQFKLLGNNPVRWTFILKNHLGVILQHNRKLKAQQRKTWSRSSRKSLSDSSSKNEKGVETNEFQLFFLHSKAARTVGFQGLLQCWLLWL